MNVAISALIGIVVGNAIGDAIMNWLTNSVSEDGLVLAVVIANVSRLVSIVAIFFISLNILKSAGLK
ncbi:hypothetical protein ACFLV4_03975 [Chloroflexota bacterium]